MISVPTCVVESENGTSSQSLSIPPTKCKLVSFRRQVRGATAFAPASNRCKYNKLS